MAVRLRKQWKLLAGATVCLMLMLLRPTMTTVTNSGNSIPVPGMSAGHRRLVCKHGRPNGKCMYWKCNEDYAQAKDATWIIDGKEYNKVYETYLPTQGETTMEF